MLTEKLSHFFNWIGAEWVMWLLILLSVISIALMVERWLYFRRSRSRIETLVQDVRRALQAGDHRAALVLARDSQSLEGRVLAQGLSVLQHGPATVEEVTRSALIVERAAFDRYLGFLGTLGANAPFIGLFGTVLGIVGAFGQLADIQQGADRANAIMGSISEALVATAVGLVVAIPAVIAYNQFKAEIKTRMGFAEALVHELLAHLRRQG